MTKKFTDLTVSDVMAKGYTENEARAYLHGIEDSAALDMYEALKELLNVLRHGKCQLKGRFLGVQALAKAEGKA